MFKTHCLRVYPLSLNLQTRYICNHLPGTTMYSWLMTQANLRAIHVSISPEVLLLY